VIYDCIYFQIVCVVEVENFRVRRRLDAKASYWLSKIHCFLGGLSLRVIKVASCSSVVCEFYGQGGDQVFWLHIDLYCLWLPALAVLQLLNTKRVPCLAPSVCVA
jgi:hypothetical protein